MPFSSVRAAVTNQSIAVPMYEYPTIGTFWDDITGAGGASVPFVIVNPASGPGTSVDATYTSEIAENTADGIRSIGYVHSNYQDRPFQEVLDDINTWYQLYPGISGIFIDLVEEGGAAERCYMAALHNHVKNNHPNDLVILNPGTNISSAYEPYGDIFLNAENTYAAYQAGWNIQYPGFEDNQAFQNRFWQIVHTTSSGNLANALTLMRNNNAGWVYITDDIMPNPYKVTPSYWSTELASVGSLPASSIPNRGKTTLPSGCISLSATVHSTTDTAVGKNTVNSSIIVANEDTSYTSEPITKLEFSSLPSGAHLSAFNGTGWSCATSSKTCHYSSALAPQTSAPAISAALEVNCTYTDGDARVRLTNFAGNSWEVDIGLSQPSGCSVEAPSTSSTPKARFTHAAVVTTSSETTPPSEPMPLTPSTEESSPQANQPTSGPSITIPTQESKDQSPWPVIIIGSFVLLLIVAIIVWLYRRKRRVYDV